MSIERRGRSGSIARKARISLAVAAAASAIGLFPQTSGAETTVYDAIYSNPWGPNLIPYAVTGEDIEIKSANGNTGGEFVIGDENTRSVKIDSLSLYLSKTSVTATGDVTVGNYPDFWESALEISAGGNVSVNSVGSNAAVGAGGSQGAFTVKAGGNFSTDTKFTSLDGAKASITASESLSLKSLLVSNASSSFTASGDASVNDVVVSNSGSATLKSENGGISFRDGGGVSVSNKSSLSIEASNGTVDLSSLPLYVTGGSGYDTKGGTSSLTLEAKKALFSTIVVSNAGSSASITTSGDTVIGGKASATEAVLDVRAGGKLVSGSQDSIGGFDYIRSRGELGTEKGEVSIYGHLFLQNDIESDEWDRGSASLRVHGKTISIDGSGANGYAVYSQQQYLKGGNRRGPDPDNGVGIEIGDEGSTVDIAGGTRFGAAITDVSGGIRIHGDRITVSRGEGQTNVAEAGQLARLEIGDAGSGEVTLYGRVSAYGNDPESGVFVRGIHITVDSTKEADKKTELAATSDRRIAVGDAESSLIRLGNAAGEGDTETLDIKGSIKSSSGVRLYGKNITIADGMEVSRGAVPPGVTNGRMTYYQVKSAIQALNQSRTAGSVVAGDSRTESLTIEGLVEAEGGKVSLDGKSITVTSSDTPVDAIWSKGESITAGTAETTESLTVNGSILVGSSPIILDSKGSITIDASQKDADGKALHDHSVRTLTGSAKIGSESSGNVSLIGSAISQEGSIDVKGDAVSVKASDGARALVTGNGKLSLGTEKSSSVTVEGGAFASAGSISALGKNISFSGASPMKSYSWETPAIPGKYTIGITGGTVTIGSEASDLVKVEGGAANLGGNFHAEGKAIEVTADNSEGSNALFTTSWNYGRGGEDDVLFSVGAGKGDSVSITGNVLAFGQHANIVIGSRERQGLTEVKGMSKAQGGWISAQGNGVSLDASGEDYAIWAESSEFRAGTDGGSTVDVKGNVLADKAKALIGAVDTGRVKLTGLSHAKNGEIVVEGKSIEASAGTEENALHAENAAITVGAGGGDSADVSGGILAGNAGVTVGSENTGTTFVSGLTHALNAPVSIQGKAVSADPGSGDIALHAENAEILAGTEGNAAVSLKGEAWADKANVTLGSTRAKSFAVDGGLLHADHADVTIDGAEGQITAGSSGNFALAENGSAVKIGESAGSITATGNILAKSSGSVVFGKDGMVSNITGNTTAESAGSADLWLTGAGSAYNGNLKASGKSSRVTIRVTDGSMTGDIFAEHDGVVDATFTRSAFKGKVGTTYSDTVTSVALDNSSWSLTGDSNVTKLSLSGKSTVDLTGSASTLTIDKEQTGSGTFALDLRAANKGVKAAGSGSDYVVSKGSSEGIQTLVFDPNEASITSLGEGEKLYFSSVADSGMSWKTDVPLDSIGKTGGLYDSSYAIGSEAGASGGTDWFIGLVGKKDNGAASQLAGLTAPAYVLGLEMDRLNKRLGEATRENGRDTGLWVRVNHRRVKFGGMKNKISMFQVGGDLDRKVESGVVTLGLALEYTDDSAKGLGLKGNVHRMSASFYDTWKGKDNWDGWYADGVLRVGKLSTDMKGSNASSGSLNSKYWNSFATASLEGGKHIGFGKNFFFEPQAQFQVGVIDGVTYRAANGVKADNSAITSAAGRIGFRFGQDLGTREIPANWYLKADVMHEFAGDRKTKLESADGFDRMPRRYSGARTWYDAGAGFNVRIAKQTFIWADAEGVFGGGMKNAWGVNAGVKHEF